MSLSISSQASAPSPDGAAAGFGAKDEISGLPFGLVLDAQTGADRGDAARADANPTIDSDRPAPFSPADANPGESESIAALLALLLGHSATGSRHAADVNDQIEKDLAILRAIGKTKPSTEAAALVALAVPDLLQQLTSKELPNLAEQPATVPGTETPPAFEQDPAATFAAANDAGDALRSAFVDATVPATDSTGEAAASIAAEERSRIDPPFSRPTAAAPAADLIDAIRLAVSHGALTNADQGFDPSTARGFDRRGDNPRFVPPGIQIAATVASAHSAAGAAAPAFQVPALPNESDVASSIVQSLRMQMRDGVGTAVVHLEPDYLGAVTIEIRVEAGAVTATLHAENPQVRAWMQANEVQLRESLGGQGLSLDRLVVTDPRVADDRASARHHQQEQQQQQQEEHARHRPRRHEAATFEVIV